MDPAVSAIDLTHILADILPTAGVGGVLAMLMFYFYQKREKEVTALFKELTGNWKDTSDRCIDALNHNTEALTRLSERLEK